MNKSDYFIKPKIEPLDNNTQKVRRNILAASVVSFFLTIGSTGIDTEASSFLGIKFDGLNIDYIKYFLILMLAYLIISFVWSILDTLTENTLRLTGLVVKKQNSSAALYPSDGFLDPISDENEQSTIYSWWTGRLSLVKEYKRCLENLIEDDEVLSTKHHEYTEAMDKIIREEAIVSEALQRFEKKFWRFQKSQLFRWILLDVGVPVILGLGSIYFLICSLLVA